MSLSRQASLELDELIAEITVDCYDEDEALSAFENAFDEDGHFPCPGTVVGEHVEVVAVAMTGHRRELIATCERAGRRHEIALLDVEVQADAPTSRLCAAYRRWICD